MKWLAPCSTSCMHISAAALRSLRVCRGAGGPSRYSRISCCLLCVAALWACSAFGQTPGPEWQAQVRKCVQSREWDRAMQIVEQEVTRAPRDMDTRAWRARVLAWSGRLQEAEEEYVDLLRFAGSDPDDWMGLANVYLREGKIQEAQSAILAAEKLDPNRADIRVARGRILR